MQKFSNINSIMILTKLFHIPSSNLLDSQNFHFHFTKWKNKKKMHTFRSLHLRDTYWSLRHLWHSWSWYFYPKARLLCYEWNIKQLLFMLIMNGLHSDHEINSSKVSVMMCHKKYLLLWECICPHCKYSVWHDKCLSFENPLVLIKPVKWGIFSLVTMAVPQKVTRLDSWN